jgi:hypothetical protein
MLLRPPVQALNQRCCFFEVSKGHPKPLLCVSVKDLNGKSAAASECRNTVEDEAAAGGQRVMGL